MSIATRSSEIVSPARHLRDGPVQRELPHISPEAPPPTRAPSFIEGLRVLRGIAIVMVLAFNVWYVAGRDDGVAVLANLPAFGWAGVDLFFVLSGFLIFHLHHSDVGQPMRAFSFARKRLIRIFPVYWIMILATLAYTLALPQPEGGDDKLDPAVIGMSIFLLPQTEGVVGVSWSLIHEVFFYAIFAMWIVARRAISLAVTLLIGVGTVVFWALTSGSDTQPAVLRYYLNPINSQFALGVLAAWLSRKYASQLKHLAWPMIAVGAAAFIAPIFWWRNDPQLLTKAVEFDYSYALRALTLGPAAMLVVLGVVVRERNAGPKTPSPLRRAVAAPFQVLGDASYSIYLTHVAGLMAMQAILSRVGVGFAFTHAGYLVQMVLLAIGGVIFYRIVEAPMLRVLRRGSSTSVRVSTFGTLASR